MTDNSPAEPGPEKIRSAPATLEVTVTVEVQIREVRGEGRNAGGSPGMGSRYIPSPHRQTKASQSRGSFGKGAIP